MSNHINDMDLFHQYSTLNVFCFMQNTLLLCKFSVDIKSFYWNVRKIYLWWTKDVGIRVEVARREKSSFRTYISEQKIQSNKKLQNNLLSGALRHQPLNSYGEKRGKMCKECNEKQGWGSGWSWTWSGSNNRKTNRIRILIRPNFDLIKFTLNFYLSIIKVITINIYYHRLEWKEERLLKSKGGEGKGRRKIKFKGEKGRRKPNNKEGQ